MAGKGRRKGLVSLTTKSSGKAIIANLFRANEAAQQAFRDVVARSGNRLYEAVLAEMQYLRIYDTGFMFNNVRLEFVAAQRGLPDTAYTVGWKQQDFAGAGRKFYPIFVVFGTEKMPARDPIFGPREREQAQFIAELKSEASRAMTQRYAR